MRKSIKAAALAALLLAGCSKQEVRSYGAETCRVGSPGSVKVLFSFPNEPHDKIGSISLRHAKPGFFDPTVADAEPKLREAGFSMGAEAVVVTHSNQTGERVIFVVAEAICFRSPKS